MPAALDKQLYQIESGFVVFIEGVISPFASKLKAKRIMDHGYTRLTHRATSKTHEHIASLWRVEIPETVVNQSGARAERSATHDLMGIKPGFRVLLVGIGSKTRIGREGRGCPFPHVADHLAQSGRRIGLS